MLIPAGVAYVFAQIGGRYAGVTRDPVTNEQTHDFGIVLPNSELVHVFEFRSPWPEVFRILNVEATCGCTAASTDVDALHPGQMLHVSAKLRTRETAENLDVSVLVKGVMADGGPKSINFVLRAKSLPLISIEDDSHYIDVGRGLAGGPPLTREIKILRASNPVPWNALALEPSDPNIETEINKKGSNEWRIKLSRRTTDVTGSVNGSIRLTFLNGDQALSSQVIRHVTGYVAGAVRCSPSTLLIGTVSQKQVVTKRVSVIAEVPGELRVISVRTQDSPRMSATIETVGVHDNPVILLRYDAGDHLGQDTGVVTVVTELDGQKHETAIDYLAMVREIVK